jgi:hypothetical protein
MIQTQLTSKNSRRCEENQVPGTVLKSVIPFVGSKKDSRKRVTLKSFTLLKMCIDLAGRGTKEVVFC